MSELTYHEYHAEIADMASDVEGVLRTGKDPDGYDVTDVGAYLWERLDGHSYIIYTHSARQVLEHSTNDCAIFEQGPQKWEDWGTAFSSSAFEAMRADVSDAVDWTIELEEEDEDDDSEEA